MTELDNEVQKWIKDPEFVRGRVKTKAYEHQSSAQPAFPKELNQIELHKKIVLQVTDLKSNHNKYYCLELHEAKTSVSNKWRLFSHYGRSDDLESNPKAGQRECRFYHREVEAKGSFGMIIAEKMSPKKGYRPIQLFSSKIGSAKSVAVEQEQQNSNSVAPQVLQVLHDSALPKPVQDLVETIYTEAKNALTSTVAAQITSKGIETPLGVLGPNQIEMGETVLHKIYSAIETKKPHSELEKLSSEFYTIIPHKIGRSKLAMSESIISTLPALEKKRELLQLMRDMLKVNEGGVLYSNQVDMQYKALHCELECIEKSSQEYSRVTKYFLEQQVVDVGLQVKNLFLVKRPGEREKFRTHIGNEKLLFHGSKCQNWVGILSRGILLPKVIESMGVKRTNFGWLGAGIYFGADTDTSAIYCTPASTGSQYMLICRVALGSIAKYTKITQHLESAPQGYHSCQGVRSTPHSPSDFTEDEFVIYEDGQHFQEFLIEFSTSVSQDTMKEILAEKAKGSSQLPTNYSDNNNNNNNHNVNNNNNVSHHNNNNQFDNKIKDTTKSPIRAASSQPAQPIEAVKKKKKKISFDQKSPDLPNRKANLENLPNLPTLPLNGQSKITSAVPQRPTNGTQPSSSLPRATLVQQPEVRYVTICPEFESVLGAEANLNDTNPSALCFENPVPQTRLGIGLAFVNLISGYFSTKEVTALKQCVLDNNEFFFSCIEAYAIDCDSNELLDSVKTLAKILIAPHQKLEITRPQLAIKAPWQTTTRHSSTTLFEESARMPPTTTHNGTKNAIDFPQTQELLMLVGRPASGKSTFCSKYLPSSYVVVNRDTIKDMNRCFSIAQTALEQGKSVCVDNTNVNSQIRAQFLKLSVARGIPARAIVFQTDNHLADKLLNYRESTTGIHVPKIAVGIFWKKYEAPTKQEGFSDILTYKVNSQDINF